MMQRRIFVTLAAGATIALATRSFAANDAITAEAMQAVVKMGQTLASGAFSFETMTIREFQKDNLPLHIFHEASVTVRRPDRIKVEIKGDDGNSAIAYDGKTLTIYNATANRYGTMPITGSIETMLRTASEKMGIDFPLADLLADQPGKSFVEGVISGVKVGEVTINGQPCNHLFFIQPPGIELELWTEANDQALPRRIIITYRSVPGEPQFIAEMSNWKLGLNPPDDAFVIQLPAGATKVEAKEQAQ